MECLDALNGFALTPLPLLREAPVVFGMSARSATVRMSTANSRACDEDLGGAILFKEA